MPDDVTTDPADLAAGSAATLTAILRRYDEHCDERARQRVGPVSLEIEDAGVALARWKTSADISPRWVSALDDVRLDPVRFSLKASAREVDWRAYAEGGLDLMHEVSDLAQELGSYGGLIDEWWNNIGGPNDTWWSDA